MEEECAICLQKYLYPVTLPCKHTFCFLCIKGIRSSSANKKCALCRVDFSLDVLEQQLAIAPPKIDNESQVKWFYSGRGNGWWQYDDRTSQEIEEAFQDASKTETQISIVGFLYTVDFDTMRQFRTSDPTRHRKVKRESITSSLKDLCIRGIAGLKLQDQNNTPDNGASVCDNLDSSNEEGPSVASNYSQSQSQNSSVDQSTEQLSSPGSDLDTSVSAT